MAEYNVILEHAALLLSGLNRLMTERRHVDVTISAGSVRFECHRLVMAIFSKLFCEKYSDINNKEITVKDDPTDLVSHLYNWQEVTYLDYLNNLMPIAQDLGIEFLLQSWLLKKKTTFDGEELVKRANELRLKTFYEGLQNYWKSETLVDVVLEVGLHKIKCHKVILSALSDYFDTMFTSGMLEETGGNVCLQGVDPEIMKEVLNYIYTGKISIDVTNADIMMSTSTYLQIPSLQCKCEDFLADHLDSENCVDVLNLATDCSCSKLREDTLRYIRKHFTEITTKHTTKFYTIPPDVFEALIQSDDLIVSDEGAVLNVVLLWFDKQSVKEETILLNLLNCLRLHLISSETLKQHLDGNKHIQQYPSCKKLILQSTLEPHRKQTSVAKRRRDEVMIVLQGSGYLKGLNLACYSFQTGLWYDLTGISSYTPGCSYAACVGGRSLYVSGGTNSPRSFYRYCLDTNRWLQLENMIRGRSEHSMVVLEDKLYCIGGTIQPKPSISCVDVYHGNSWRKAGDLSVPTANAGCATCGDNILVFGGTKSFGVFNHEIQSYNTRTNQCTIISRFPKRYMSGLLNVVSQKGTFYFTTADGKVLQYTPDGGEPDVIGVVHSQNLIGYSTVVYNDDIYVLGGSSVKSEIECTRQFNIGTRKCSIIKEMKLPFEPASNQYYGAVVMISKSHLEVLSK